MPSHSVHLLLSLKSGRCSQYHFHLDVYIKIDSSTCWYNKTKYILLSYFAHYDYHNNCYLLWLLFHLLLLDVILFGSNCRTFKPNSYRQLYYISRKRLRKWKINPYGIIYTSDKLIPIAVFTQCQNALPNFMDTTFKLHIWCWL